MAFVLSDRIKETTTTTSTGTYTLGGAVSGFETFTANLSNGDTTYYCCTDGTDFEVGLGTFASSGTTLARTTIISSSNSNNAVNWSSGTRDIFCTLPGSKAVFIDGDGHVSFADNEKAKFGDAGDLEIYHDGSNSIIEDVGTGGLRLKTGNAGRIQFQNAEGDILARFDGNGNNELYHNNSLRFSTTSTGAKITGGTGDGTLIIEADTDNATEEDNALLQLTQDGGLVTVDFGFDANNNILIKGNGSAANVHLQHGDELLAKGIADGAFELYHDNVKVFETTASGAKIHGNTGDAVLLLEADTGNNDEADNAFIQFSQDGGGVTAKSGIGVDGNNRYQIETTTGGGTTKFDIHGGAETRLYYASNVKLETTSTGATVTGTLVSDVISIADGSSTQDRLTIGTNNDFFIYHDNQTVIANVNGSGPIKIQGKFGEQSIIANQDGAVQLYHNNAEKFQTTSTGVNIFGDARIRATSGDANANPSLILDRQSSSPADGDDLGEILFRGKNDAAEDVDYIQLVTDITDASDGSESAQLLIKAFENGTLTQYASFNGGGGQIYFSRKLNMQSNQILGVSNIQFSGTNATDSNTQIFTETEQANNLQTNLILQAGDDATTANEDSVRIRHRNYNNVTPQDLDMAIFKRNSSDNTKADITFNGDLTLLSTDAGASAAPTLSLYRNSASPANSDDIGQIQWFAENDADEKIEYARIDVKNSGVTDGQEYGQMDFMVRHFGGELVALRLSFGLVQFYSDLYIGSPYKIQFEGSAYNDFETSLTVAGPTADRTITLPDATGDVVLNESGTVNIRSTADNGPVLNLVSNDPVDVQDFTKEASINFFAENDASESVSYAQISLVTRDVSDGTEDGRIEFRLNVNGVADKRVYIFDRDKLSFDNDQQLEWLNYTGSNSLRLNPTTLTATRDITLPNASGSVQLNQGNGESNGGFQNFQQDYQSSSYFTAGEYIEIATLNPTTNSSNFNFTGTIMAQVSNNVQVLHINVGIRFNSSGSFNYGIAYNSQQVGDDYVEPVLWANTSTDTIKLVIQGKTGSIHKVGVNLCFFQRSNYDDITWNTTVVQDTTSVPSGFTEYIGEKTFSSALNGAVELYHNNVKKLETTSSGVTTTGSILPSADDTYDLGSSSAQWRDIYTGDINLNNTKTRDNEVDGTRGSWTIQEGADDLFLINRVSGKKYKFKLEEIK